jgi:hypothetical protein
MRHRLVLAIALLPVLFSSGCIAPIFVEAAMDPMGYKAAFKSAQHEYTKMVRWADIEGAAKYVHPEMREEFLSYEGSFEGIRVTDFEVGEVQYGEGEATATVRVTYHAFAMDAMLEKKIKETQHWERTGKSNQSWVVRPDLERLVAQVADIR